MNSPGRSAHLAAALLLSLCVACAPKDGKDGKDAAPSLMLLTEEPPGANCQSGGTRVQSGPDTDRDGVLDPGEVTATSYVCYPDSVHPTVVFLGPPDGSVAPPSAIFCARFSEPIDSTSLDGSNLFLTGGPAAGPVATTLGYHAAAKTACLTPSTTLAVGYTYTLQVGGEGTLITDLAGNPMLAQAAATCLIGDVAVAPELRVTIDAVTPGLSTVEVAFTVYNDGLADAGPFQLGLFVDPASPPGAGSTPDVAVGFDEGLPALLSASGTATLDASADAFLWAYVDVTSAVAEGDEWNNAFVHVPAAALPALTGAPTLVPLTVEEGAAFQLSIPVSATVRRAEVYLGGFYDLLGAFSGNAGGEGVIVGYPAAPASGWLGTWTLWLALYDETGYLLALYEEDPAVSAGNYTLRRFNWWEEGARSASGIPLASLTIVPSTSANLVARFDAVAIGSGTVEVGFTVTNVGAVGAVPSDLGFFVDPATRPGVGATPVATVAVGALAAGGSESGSVTLNAGATAAISAYADIGGAVDEASEFDNLAEYVPYDGPAMTGSPVVVPSSVDDGGTFDVTIPVSSDAREVTLYIGTDYPGSWFMVGQLAGNEGGEGFIAGTVTLPHGVDGSWILGVCVTGGPCYLPTSTISAVNYALWFWFGGLEIDTGIPLTPVTVLYVPPVCGDGEVWGAEACDGADLAGMDCRDFPFTGGTLACASDCLSFDTSACTGSIAGWTCNPNYYGTADGCDCGCGLPDPDCADLTVASCEFCSDSGSCSTTGCPGTINPTNNAVCN